MIILPELFEFMSTQDPQTIPGGVVMADMPVSGSVSDPGVTASIPVSQAETVVVGTETTAPPIASQVPGGGTVWLRRILVLVVFLLVLGGLVVAFRFVWQFFQSNQEVTIQYWGLWEPDDVVKGVIADFEAKNPKIKVSYIKQSPKQYRERVSAAINRGDGPDVFRFHNTWVAMLRNELLPVPATVMSAGEFASTFYPVAASDLAAGQTIYGIPMMIEGLGLYYNPDLFAAAGVSPPVTWEDVLNIVPKLTVKNGNDIVTSAIALGTTNNIENFSDILATMMLQNGANLREPTGKEAEEALIFFRKFSDPADPVYTWNSTLDNSVYAFAMGKVAMILAPSWRAFDLKLMNPQNQFKIVPIPQLPGNTVTWASYWVEGISVKTKYPKQAAAFLSYLTSRETVTRLYTDESKVRLFGEPYARKELGSSLEADPYVGAYIKQANAAKSFPLASRTFDNGINDKLIKYLEDAINGYIQGSAPGAALETATAGFRQVLGSLGLSAGAAP